MDRGRYVDAGTTQQAVQPVILRPGRFHGAIRKGVPLFGTPSLLFFQYIVINVPFAVQFADDVDGDFRPVARCDDRMNADAGHRPCRPNAVDVRFAIGVDVNHRFNARLRARFGAQAEFFPPDPWRRRWRK